MKKSRDFIKANPNEFNGPDEDLNLSDLDLDSQDSNDTNDDTVTDKDVTPSSPKIVETDPIKSVSNAVETINKTRKLSPTKATSQPTGEPKKRGRPAKT